MRKKRSLFLSVFFVCLIASSFLVQVALAADTSDYVDNNTSDVDSHADHGTQSSFAAEQSAPDSSFDTLTEAATASPTFTQVFNSGFQESPWNDKWNAAAGTWIQGTSAAPGAPWAPHSGSNMAYCSATTDGYIYSDPVDCSDATSIGVVFWYMDDDLDGGTDFDFWAYDGASWDSIVQLNPANEDQWYSYTWNTTDSQYFDATFSIRFGATPESNENAFIDDIVIEKISGAYNYELNLEGQWTTADYDESNEILCIYAGVSSNTNGEALMADVWNGGSWVTVIADLGDSQWNNVSVSSYLTSGTLTMRFMCDTESGDNSLSTWQIDSVLLHTYSSGVFNKAASLSISMSLSSTRNIHVHRSGSLVLDWAGAVSRTLRFPRSGSLSIDLALSSSRRIIVTRGVSLILDWAVSASRGLSYSRVASLVLDWAGSASRTKGAFRTGTLAITMALSSSMNFGVTRIVSLIMDFSLSRILPAGAPPSAGDFTDPGDLAEIAVISLILIPMGILLLAVLVRRR